MFDLQISLCSLAGSANLKILPEKTIADMLASLDLPHITNVTDQQTVINTILYEISHIISSFEFLMKSFFTYVCTTFQNCSLM